MSISLELPPGVAPPTMKGTLTGPPDDLRIEIRLADFVAALGHAKDAGATVALVPHGLLVDAAKPATKKATAKKAATKKKAGEAAQRWNSGAPPLPLKQSEDSAKDYAPSEGSAGALVVAHLKTGPASSLELTSALPQCTPASIYKACQYMRDKGLIEQEISEHDGTRRWLLAQHN